MNTVERDWTTESGLRAVVLMVRGSHRCGYVALPPSHPLHGKEYGEPCEALEQLHAAAVESPIGNRGIIPLVCHGGLSTPDVVFRVHGGLTYSEAGGEYPVESSTDDWWFGFDCAHYGDAAPGGQSLDYCVSECESLASQLAGVVSPA